MATFDLSAPSDPRMSHLVVGAVSPLWAFYSAAAAGGLAYWWMSRWTQSMNLEAWSGAFAKASDATMTARVAEPAVNTPLGSAPLSSLPLVGGEAAPISPLVDSDAAEPAIEAAGALPVAMAAAVQKTAKMLSEGASDTAASLTKAIADAPAADVKPLSPAIEPTKPTVQLTETPQLGQLPKARVRKGPPAAEY